MPALRNRPELLAHESLALDAYMQVANSRPSSFGEIPRPVPISEVSAAYEYLGLAEHFTRTQWLRIVVLCDSAVIEHAEREAERKKKRDKK